MGVKIAIEQQAVHSFTEKAYLNYAMYVILDRALPHLADGLKPVQRRIVYAMSELGLTHLAKYKKSARTVGDVLGKFHPHGDSACYEAMVLMAQPFSYRYPLIDGQGNWGSSDDPKSFAAMRYTESKLTAYANTLLQELGQGTTPWKDNFDGTLQEPKLLPAALPNILINGSSGIAVGMTTDIPPHNIQELINACIFLLDNKKASVSDLCEYVPGPDYPTGGEIISSAENLRQIYTTGVGALRVRGLYQQEEGAIIITQLPYQVSGAKILEQIAKQIQAKKLPQLIDLRDESDHEEPIRLVLVPRSNRVDIEEIMDHLFATTDLEKNYRVNLNMIGLNGKPEVKDLKTILSQWLEFRQSTIKKRLQYRLDKVDKRLHLLEGFLVAFLNIDAVLKIIRQEDKPKPVLMKRFKLTDLQAEAVLELKLRHLAKLEEIKINAERDELAKEQMGLQQLLSSSSRLKTLLKKELKALGALVADQRRSLIVEKAVAKTISKQAQIPLEAMSIILSKKGWVRAAKGHEVQGSQLSYKTGDEFLCLARGTSHQDCCFLASDGRSYVLSIHSLPSARGHGEPLTGRLFLQPGSRFSYMVPLKAEQNVLLLSSQGYGFSVSSEHLETKNKKGKQVMRLSPPAVLLPPLVLNNEKEEFVVLVSKAGKLLIIPVDNIPHMEKGKGARLLKISTKLYQAGKDNLCFVQVLNKKQSLVFKAARKEHVLSYTKWKVYLGELGTTGKVLPKGVRNVKDMLVR